MHLTREELYARHTIWHNIFEVIHIKAIHDNNNAEKADCFRCIYFAVTWDPAFPKACKLYGFRSAYLPSLAVLKSSGVPCMGFIRKEIPKAE